VEARAPAKASTQAMEEDECLGVHTSGQRNEEACANAIVLWVESGEHVDTIQNAEHDAVGETSTSDTPQNEDDVSNETEVSCDEIDTERALRHRTADSRIQEYQFDVSQRREKVAFLKVLERVDPERLRIAEDAVVHAKALLVNSVRADVAQATKKRKRDYNAVVDM